MPSHPIAIAKPFSKVEVKVVCNGDQRVAPSPKMATKA